MCAANRGCAAGAGAEGVTAKCAFCGAEFLRRRGTNRIYCSAECGKKAHSLSRRTREPEAVSAETLRTARTEPRATSDVRWRIELRRRARAKYFLDFGDPVQ